MNDTLDRLESAFVEMRETVAGLEARIARLEQGKPLAPGVPLEPDDAEPTDSLASDLQGPLAVLSGTPALIGRSLLVLAGAFLLRAMTESGTFSPQVGVAAGVAYAAVWIVVSSIACRKGERLSAVFYAACTALIVGPLLVEAVTSFNVLSPMVGVVALALMTAAGLMEAARWRLQWAAWIYSILGMTTAAAMATMRPPGEAATAFLVLLGLAVLWLADERDWAFLKWVTAIAADLAVLRLTAIALAPGARPENFGPVHPPVVAFLQILLVAGYVGTAVFRALRGRQKLSVFAFVQTVLVALVGWGGGLQLAWVQGWGTVGLSLFAVLVGIVAYCGAFGVVDRLQGKNRAFFYLSSLGLCLVLIGLPGVIGQSSAVVWSAAAVAVAVVGSRWDRVTLRVHAAVLLLAAWVVSGFGENVAAGLAGETGEGSGTLQTILVAVLTVAATAVVLFGRRPDSTGWLQRLPLTGLLAMSAFVVATGLAIGAASIPGLGNVAVAGTVALSVVTVGLAFLASRGRVSEAGWLVYPFLAVTGVRMLAVDLSSGHTLVLVMALTAYGTALIVSTWLLRGARTQMPAQ